LGELVLVDVVQRAMLRYRVDGARAVPLGPLPHPTEGGVDFSRPLDLQPATGGFVLLDGTDRLLWLDADGHPNRALRLPDDLDVEGAEVAGLPELTTVGDDVFGLYYQAGKGGHWRGWVHIDPTTGGLERLLSDDKDARRARLNALTHPLVATAGGTAYALLHGDPPAILSLGEPPHRLQSAFPPGSWRLPTVPERGGPDTTVAAFRALAVTPMPLALYGRGPYLYLLTRRRVDGAPHWQLHQIDPRRDRLLRSLDLPTTAAHLFLVPGDDVWAIVEKGEIVTPGEQEVESILLLPASWIEKPGTQTWPLSLADCVAEPRGDP
jgi:hypothetical protein